MSPGHKRQIAESFVAAGRCSARSACRHFGLHRGTYGYQAKEPDAWLARLKTALRRISNTHMEWGYAKITRLLQSEGWKVGARLVQRLRRVMARLIEEHGAPEHIRSDNGSEFIERNLRHWLAGNKIKTLYIDPGSPWQNGYIESFNARLRDECLNREQLWTLTEARVVLEDWRWQYNHVRPHRTLGYITPVSFAQKESEEQQEPQCWPSSRPAAFLRSSIDLLYDLNHTNHEPRLTLALA